MAEGGKQDKLESPYSNPVFKKISLKNGEINKMTHTDLQNLAKKLKIGGEGSTEILRKRLKSHYRKNYLTDAALKMPKKTYAYYIVIDFEATCEDKDSPRTNFPHEIIEFPAVIVNSDTLTIEDIFHEYVRPVINNKLSDYCTSLTGISQSQVDSADTFPRVLERFMVWLQEHNLIGRSAIVTDGPWDMGRFLYTQVKLCKLPYPKFAKQWVNIKKTFSNFYNQRKPSLDVMLQQLNFKFEGRRHSGRDDSCNIAKVLIQMLKDGSYVHINEKIDLSTFQSQIQRPVHANKRYMQVGIVKIMGFHFSAQEENDMIQLCCSYNTTTANCNPEGGGSGNSSSNNKSNIKDRNNRKKFSLCKGI